MDNKDRTFEFYAAIKSLTLHQNQQINSLKQKVPNEVQASYFSSMTKKVGKDLSNTYAKLEKLTMLAKSKTLFDDHPEEIEELTFIIKQDIQSLNTHILELSKYLKKQNYDHIKGKKHVEKHSNSVIYNLQSKLVSMSTEFKQILEMRNENVSQQRSRESQFIENSNNKFMHSLHGQNETKHFSKFIPSSTITGYRNSHKATNAYPRKDTSILMDNDSSTISPNSLTLSQTQRQTQAKMADQTESYLASRADTMQTIESTIVELGSIFSQLSTMVKEQDEIIQRIDMNVEESHFAIEAAHSEILKYFQSLSSNRWLMIKIFGILIVFFIIFVIFFA